MGWKTVAIVAAGVVFTLTGCGAPQSTTGTGNSQSNTVNSTNNAVNNTSSVTASTQETTPLMNKPAPSFQMEVYGENGKTISLKQILQKGQPVILNAFASWCPPCNMEAPDLKKLQEQYKGKLQVVGVDMTNYDTLSGLKTFVNKYGLPYSVLLDKKSVFLKSYDVAAYPTTFGISASGKVVAFHLGYMTKQDMQAMAKQLLSKS